MWNPFCASGMNLGIKRPVLRAVAVLGVMVIASSATSAPIGAVEQEVLDLVNQQRVAAGCGPLVAQDQLAAAAHGHSDAMAFQNFFSHTGKRGMTMSRRVKAQGYAGRLLAENIAAGQSSAREVVTTWMHSAGHRRNILNCRYTETGIALTYQANDAPIKGSGYGLHYYWVQVFGRP
jgi:uncharacterized protein YkwD